MLFSVIIPNYNSEAWIERGLTSIFNQTFKDWELIIVDDISKDSSFEMIKKILEKSELKNPMLAIKNKEKRFNGGTRNEGVRLAKGDYLLFMDCDDWFFDNMVFQEIANVIKKNNNPDIVRLPYKFEQGQYSKEMMICESTPQTLVDSIFVAPWTKCVKRELFVPFPENTMLEDVVQHIAQIDNIETVAVCERPCIIWNRNNRDAISQPRKRSKIIQEENLKRLQEYCRFNGFGM